MRVCHLLVVLPALFFACNNDELTHDEASQALTEAAADSQAENLTATPVEISTNFTIGSAVESAAADLRTFLASELPCATATVSGATVTTQWGTAGAGCAYKGQTYTGTTSVTVKSTGPGNIEVDHSWSDFSNGSASVSGSAQVTWSASSSSRHVVHQLQWTRLSDGRQGTGTGDRTQTLIDPAQGIAGGIRIDGNRHWSGARGDWNLAVTGVEVRLQDPVPQAGTYSLTTPANKNLSLSFSRLTTNLIRVTVAGPKHSFSFNVLETGSISDS